VPRIFFCCCPLHTLGIVMHILGLWWILITGPICSQQDPKCAMGLHQNVSGHHGSFWEKKTPKDGLGQGQQTCEKRSTEQHFWTHCWFNVFLEQHPRLLHPPQHTVQRFHWYTDVKVIYDNRLVPL
jgi:hypothetical protein